jgi:N-acetylmuramoyl-L-alanine amidase
MLIAVAVACVIAVMHLNDLQAAVMGVAGMAAPLAGPTAVVPTGPSPATDASPAPAPVGQPAAPGGAHRTCVSFPPAESPSGQTVFVDAGHGGPDPGVVGEAGSGPVTEKAVTLAVATRLTPLLQHDGYRVVMSRTSDSFVAANPSSGGSLTADDIRRDLLARIACANAAGANLLLSIHFNGLTDPSIGGSETFYDAARPFAASNRRLALDLQRSITSALGSANLGVWPDDQNVGPALSAAGSLYGHLIELGPPSPGYVDKPSQMPGALVEPLFLSNPPNARQAADPVVQQRIAVAIDSGIRGYFSGA